jgi:hypothetical protein
VAKVFFPNEPVSERTVFRPFTAPGMFAFRHLQADHLIYFPDFAAGDMTSEQRRNALDQAVPLYRPLTALVIFLNVVALEDLIRDLGARLAEVVGLSAFFPRIDRLQLTPKSPNPSNPSARLDKEPVSYTDFQAVNALYLDVLDVEPISAANFPRLYDLALVRHTVAHHGAIFRQIDVPRFQHYDVVPGQLINPPVAFVKETCGYLYSIGTRFEKSMRQKVISGVVPKLDPTWVTTPPKLLLDLIELFDYFGKFVTSSGPVVSPVQSVDDVVVMIKEESERGKRQLVSLCVDELRANFLPHQN